MIAPLAIPAAAQAAALDAVVPRLLTPRGTLRAPRPADFGTLQVITGSGRVSAPGGPSTPAETGADFRAGTATWLLRGHGIWTLELAEGDIAGFVLIGTEPGDREHELGWLLTAEHESREPAFEAAAAAHDHARIALRLPSLVSCIAPGNARSERLATRLGAVSDGTLHGGRIAVWRHRRETA